MNMAENHMVLGEYDTRPEMTDADLQDRIDDYEAQLVDQRLESLIEHLQGSDFVRQVVAVLLSNSQDKLYEIRNIFYDGLNSRARELADKE